jgi:hypothetical protein
MADDPQADLPNFVDQGSPTLQQLADYTVEKLTDPVTLKKLETTLSNAGQRADAVASAALTGTLKTIVEVAAVPLAVVIAKTMLALLESSEPITSEVAKVALDAVLGEGKKRAGIPSGIGQKIIEKLSPAGASVEPSIDGAAHYMDIIVGLNMETWLMGFLGELLGDSLDMYRGAGISLEAFSELRNVITQVFGGGRITRRVLAPFIDDGIVQPAKRWTSQKYRPQLLGVSESIRAYLRGDWEIDRITEESSQQGYSDERLQVLVENARKRLTIDELIFRHFRGEISDVETATLARGLGYDEATTLAKLAIEDAKRIDALNAPVVSEAIANFIAGDIDDRTLERWVNGAAPNATDASRMIATAKARREIAVKHIASTRMRALVLEGIASVVDYTAALARENYPPDEITLEELSLRVEQGEEAAPGEEGRVARAARGGRRSTARSISPRSSGSPAFRALSDAAQAIELAIVQAKIDKRAADDQAKIDGRGRKRAREGSRARGEAEPGLPRAHRVPHGVRPRLHRPIDVRRGAHAREGRRRRCRVPARRRRRRPREVARRPGEARRRRSPTPSTRASRSRRASRPSLQGILTLQEFDASLAKDKLDDDDRGISS